MKRLGCVCVVLMLMVTGCTNDPGTIVLNNGGLADDFGVVVVDTTTIAVSTVLLDSVSTSGTGSLLIGGYSDSKIGRIQAAGYVQIGIGDAWTPPTDAIFDSLVFIAHFSKYTYGDTSNAQTVEIRRVTEPFRTYTLPQFWASEGQYSVLYADGSKYNTSAMRADVTPLGTRTFRFRPNSSDSVVIRLSDDLGSIWLSMTKQNVPDMTILSNFHEYFKGLSIAVSDANPTAVVGLNTDQLRLRLYYRTYVNERSVQQYHDYTFVSTFYNYTKITPDRSGSLLASLSNRQQGVSSSTTEGEAFVQSGTGVVTKITFPYITNLLRQSNAILVNSAQLIIEPVRDSFDEKHPLPGALTLYTTNKTNLPLSRVYANYSTTDYQTAAISFDKEYDTSTGYKFVLTQYISTLLETEGVQDLGLLIMPAGDELHNSVNKVHIGAGTGGYRVKLKIWYTYEK